VHPYGLNLVHSSTIIEEVAESCREDDRSALAYFYFNFQDEHRKPKDLLRALLLQFALQLTDADVYLNDLYLKSMEGLRDPQIEDIEEALKNLVNTCTSAYIVIDALNECQDTELLLKILGRMIGWTSVGQSGADKLNLLATTIPNDDLESQLDEKNLEKHYIELESKYAHKDIVKFVNTQLTTDRRLRIWPKSQQTEIRNALTEKSEGMYDNKSSSPQP